MMSFWPQLGSYLQRSRGPTVSGWTSRSSFLFLSYPFWLLIGCNE
jgi:hypothetical protein